MALIALPPDPASPADATIAADDWFPEIDPNDVRDKMRVGNVVTHQRLTFAIQGALLSIMGELAAWKAARVSDGAAQLDEVDPDSTVAGEHRLTLLFRRAVYCSAAADLAEQHREMSATDDGDGRAEEVVPAGADFRRMATHAVRDILGTTRTAVELI